MNTEAVERLIGLHADLEAAGDRLAATVQREIPTPNAASCLGKYRKAKSALDAYRAELEARPSVAQVCATCEHWKVYKTRSYDECRYVRDLFDVDSHPEKAWLSRSGDQRLMTIASFGCTAWRERKETT